MTIINAMNEGYNWRFRFPSKGFWSDNGGEFQNDLLEEYASKAGFSIKFGAEYSPWSNRMNKRNHYIADIAIRKLMEEGVDLEKAVDIAAWTHNTNMNKLGYDPLSLVTGKAVIFPGILSADIATESMYDNKAIKRIMERNARITKKFREVEYETKLKKAPKVQNKRFINRRHDEGDSVFYQKEDKNSWHGPVKVIAHRVRSVFVMANRNIRKEADCKVQPFGSEEKKTDNRDKVIDEETNAEEEVEEEVVE